jgi:hypothetical protein
MVITAVREQEYAANTDYDNERRAIWNHILA